MKNIVKDEATAPDMEEAQEMIEDDSGTIQLSES